MADMNAPLGLRSELSALTRREMLAELLRQRAMTGSERPNSFTSNVTGGSVVTPSFGAIRNAIDASAADRDIAEIDSKRGSLLAGFERDHSAAMQDLMRMDQPGDQSTIDQQASAYSRAMQLGIDPSGVQSRRRDREELEQFLGAGTPPLGSLGFGGGEGNPRQGLSPMFGFGSPPQQSANRLAGLPEERLILASTSANKRLAALAKAELEQREVKYQDGVWTNKRGEMLGGFDPKAGIAFVRDENGEMIAHSVPEYAGIKARQAGDIKRAESEAAAQYQTVTVPLGNRTVTMPLSEFIEHQRGVQEQKGQGNSMTPPPVKSSAPPGGWQVPAHVQYQRELEAAALKRKEGAPAADIALSEEYARRAQRWPGGATSTSPAPTSPAGDVLGLSADPLEQRRLESDIDAQKQARIALGGNFIEQELKPTQDQAKAARSALRSLDALDRNPIATGWGTDAKSAAARFLVGIGHPSKDAERYASNAQAFNAITTQQVWSLLRDIPGPDTDKDYERAQGTYSQLGNTPEANQFIRDMHRAIAQIAINKNRHYESRIARAQKDGNLWSIRDGWQEPSVWDMPSMKRWSNRFPSSASGSNSGANAGWAIKEIR